MKAKKVLIFGGSGQIGRNLIRKLTSTPEMTAPQK